MARTKAERTKANQARAKANSICKFLSDFFWEETELTYNNCFLLMREFSKIARTREMTFRRLRSFIGCTHKEIDIDVLIFITACEKEWMEKHSSKNSTKSDADEDSDYDNGSDEDSDYDNTKKRTAEKRNDVTERVPKNLREAEATPAIPWTTLTTVEALRRSNNRHLHVPKLEDAQKQLKDFANSRALSLGKPVARVLFNDASTVYLEGSTETKPISATAMDEPAITLKWKLVYAGLRPEGIFCIWVSNDANTWTGVRPLDSIRFG